MDINELTEVMVKYRDGQEIVFRGKGLEKLRKMMKASPPLQSSEPKKAPPKVTVVEESGSEEEEVSEEEPPVKPTKKSKAKAAAPLNGGYNTVHLEYGGPKATN